MSDYTEPNFLLVHFVLKLALVCRLSCLRNYQKRLSVNTCCAEVNEISAQNEVNVCVLGATFKIAQFSGCSVSCWSARL